MKGVKERQGKMSVKRDGRRKQEGPEDDESDRREHENLCSPFRGAKQTTHFWREAVPWRAHESNDNALVFLPLSAGQRGGFLKSDFRGRPVVR